MYTQSNRIRNVHINSYTTHYAYAYNYILYVLSEKGDRLHLLRDKFKLAK